MKNIIKYHPAVCPVRDTYQIIVVTQCEALISIKVGNRYYFNHSNGIRISSAGVHKFSVPVQELDCQRKYTVVAANLTERLAYFTNPAESVEQEYEFKPLEKTVDINIYHIADCHGMFEQAVDIAKNCGREIDLLVLNGDISSTSDSFDDMTLWCKIASVITGGKIPCVVSRGNHDLRGSGAQKLAECMPTDCGKSYYTFRAGCVWGMLVDAGEDKDDESLEYGETVCCHDFRLEQDKMISDTVGRASGEYEADGIEYKLVISHIPFTFRRNAPFDIEKELYSKWAKTIKENINPDIMLCGHTHTACISECGSEYDELGHPCTIVVGSDVSANESGEKVLGGLLITLNSGFADVSVNNKNGILFEDRIDFKKHKGEG